MSTPNSIPFFLAEAFTKGDNEAYSGNPAGIVFLNYDDDICDDTKQKIASTLQASTSAVVSEKGWKKDSSHPNGDLAGQSNSKILKRVIRWFTPTSEVPMCGHATFATAKVLASMFPEVEVIEFDTKFRGIVTAAIQRESGKENDPIVCLDFPANVASKVPEDSAWLPELTRIFLGPANNGFEDIRFSPTQHMLLLILKRIEGEAPIVTLCKISPNFQQLIEADLGGLDVHGCTVTIRGDALSNDNQGQKAHCYSRQFSPFIGINEDPVCGSAHTMVIPYWTDQLKMHGQYLLAHQASPRGGDLRCRLTDEGRVKLCGRGRIVAEGRLNV